MCVRNERNFSSFALSPPRFRLSPFLPSVFSAAQHPSKRLHTPFFPFPFFVWASFSTRVFFFLFSLPYFFPFPPRLFFASTLIPFPLSILVLPPPAPQRGRRTSARGPAGGGRERGFTSTPGFSTTHTHKVLRFAHTKRGRVGRGENAFFGGCHTATASTESTRMCGRRHISIAEKIPGSMRLQCFPFLTHVFFGHFFASVRLRDPFLRQNFCENRCFHTCCPMLGCHCGAKIMPQLLYFQLRNRGNHETATTCAYRNAVSNLLY